MRDAIQAATVNAAELIGWQDKVGALEPGHYADVIAVQGNPLENVKILESVSFVMKGGEIVPERHAHEIKTAGGDAAFATSSRPYTVRSRYTFLGGRENDSQSALLACRLGSRFSSRRRDKSARVQPVERRES